MWDHKKLEKTKREEAEKLMKEEGMVSEEMVDLGWSIRRRNCQYWGKKTNQGETEAYWTTRMGQEETKGDRSAIKSNEKSQKRKAQNALGTTRNEDLSLWQQLEKEGTSRNFKYNNQAYIGITNQLINIKANQVNYKSIQSHNLRETARACYNSGISLREKLILKN